MELYKRNIARIGGDNAELAVRNSLKYILTYDIAIRYSWTGQKQAIKFSQHKIIDGILETIIKTGNTTITDLQNTVKEWLRHAKDRVRYQRKKELAAMRNV
ncbi:unnamed protein product [Lasius platythorax]|uniref:DUF4806 domain-containing protein n=1 Tax=Lasius platythorax TaxID=488582 RepID=A0AAV2NGW7_9HYME